MPQIFHSSVNTAVRAGLLGGVLAVAAGTFGWAGLVRSDYVMRVRYPLEQPVPFSHEHHVGGLGLDCRYCHASVEKSSFAGLPATEVCMTCHSQLWTQAEMLEPVRRSFATGEPLRWKRVHDLPDFVYFDHSIHVAKGFGCTTCHGDIDGMPLTFKAQPLWMRWCLDCHREPERFVRPRGEVFNARYRAAADHSRLGQLLVRDYHIRSNIECSACHR